MIKYSTVYKDETTFVGTVTRYTQKEGNSTIYLSAKEDILISYYNDIDIQIGDVIEVTGNITDILPNTIPNTFNYKKYLYNNHIYTKVVADKIKIVSHSNNLLVKAKNIILNRSKCNTYLLLFICGDKTGMDSEIYNNFKDCGIAHLLAISGMHVSVFILILNKLLFFISKNKRNILIISFLIFYCYLVNFTPSILRVVISFILGVLLSNRNIHISSIKKLLLTAFIIILIDPFNIYSTSFLYSFSAALGVISTENRQKNNYFINIIIISFYTLLFTLPITINLNYEINLMLFISNLLFIPYVSFLLYPLGLLTFIFPFLNYFFIIFSRAMEQIINIINKVDIFSINVPKMPIILIVAYYLILYLYLFYNKRKAFFLIMGIIPALKLYTKMDYHDYVIFFDIGQGDCAALISKFRNEVILIDTGGVKNFKVSDNVILYLKSIGITKINTLVLSHGDSDHLLDASNIINKLQVKSIMINKGDINNLEKVILNYNIPVTNNIIFKNKTYYNLNNKIYNNENDNSIILNIQINKYYFTFMGDASKEVEKTLNIKSNVIKLGHHGSKTSSDYYFLKGANPDIAIISSGRNNRYKHPNKETINTLNDLSIPYYNTQNKGTIIFKINNNNYDILFSLA